MVCHLKHNEQCRNLQPAPTEKDIRPLRDLEREAIANALRATGGHRERSAKLLGMAVRTLYRKIDQYDL